MNLPGKWLVKTASRLKPTPIWRMKSPRLVKTRAAIEALAILPATSPKRQVSFLEGLTGG